MKMHPHSYVMVCPTCGECWGTVVVEGGRYQPLSNHCSRHGGGHLLTGWSDAYVEGCPTDVLANEILIGIEEFTHGRTWS